MLAEVEARIGPYLKDRRTLEPNLAGPVVDLAARNGDAARFDALPAHDGGARARRRSARASRWRSARSAIPRSSSARSRSRCPNACRRRTWCRCSCRHARESRRARAHLGVHPRALDGPLAARLAGARVAAGLGAARAAEAALPPPGRELLRDASAADRVARAEAGARALRPRRRSARARSCPTCAAICAATERDGWSLSEDLLARPFAAVREACAEVAASRAPRRDRGRRARALRRRASARRARHEPDELPRARRRRRGAGRVHACVSTRSTSARAGSRSSRKRPGHSGYRTIEASLRERFERAGPFTRARAARARRARRRGAARPDAPLAPPIAELMELYARALRDLGELVASAHRRLVRRLRRGGGRLGAPRWCAACSRCRSTATSRARRHLGAVPEARAAHGLGPRARAAREPRPLSRPRRAHDLRRQPGAARAAARRRAALRLRSSSRASRRGDRSPAGSPRRSRSAPARWTPSSRSPRACARGAPPVDARATSTTGSGGAAASRATRPGRATERVARITDRPRRGGAPTPRVRAACSGPGVAGPPRAADLRPVKSPRPCGRCRGASARPRR